MLQLNIFMLIIFIGLLTVSTYLTIDTFRNEYHSKWQMRMISITILIGSLIGVIGITKEIIKILNILKSL